MKIVEKLDKQFWTEKYKNNESGWDKGEITPPLKGYIDQLEDKSLRILIPGAGNAHEAEYLHRNGFSNVYVVDISPIPIQNLKERVPSFPEDHMLCHDFFELDKEFDLIIEQTFFCAINPNLRTDYASKCNNLLVKGGKIVGLMFNFPLTEEGPPFGGSKEEYHTYFDPYFNIELMDEARNSTVSRVGRELFVKLRKK